MAKIAAKIQPDPHAPHTHGAPSASYSITLRVQLKNRVGMLGKIASTIGSIGGDIGAVDLVSATKEGTVRDLTVDVGDTRHGQQVIEAVKKLQGVRVLNVSDRTFLMHLGGKIQITSKIPLRTRADLSMAYTPGVARVCMAIAEDKSRAQILTIRKNCIAVVTDGTAVLGLGDIGPEAAMPVMEGKAVLFKEFGGVDAFPICLATKDTEEIIRTVIALAPTFGGFNLEDISAPRCFEIEERLKAALDVPVFHDDQHGTAVVVLAALINALRIVRKKMANLKVVVNGIGAAGVACSKMLLAAGVTNIVGCDRTGAVYKGRKENMNEAKQWFAAHTNRAKFKGTVLQAMQGADLLLGLSAPGTITRAAVQSMAKDAMVFALANPTPEIMPEDIQDCARIIATGRSDYPNQINNVLCFPGIFRGALDCRATCINEEMKLAAAQAIASVVGKHELSEDYIIPSVFNRKVAQVVAKAVAHAAHASGVARKRRTHLNLYHA
ncbi:MAG: NAD-dependent malic enzyme [Burkholderiales bacterium]|nr:NAD-dependent malic enzyme [Burkholderiales bacterium]